MNFSKGQKRDISNLFDSISDYINVDFKKVKDRKTVGTIRLDLTLSLTNQAHIDLVFMPLQIPQMKPHEVVIFCSTKATQAMISVRDLLKDSLLPLRLPQCCMKSFIASGQSTRMIR